jgi:hypothetical protein
MSVLIGHVAVDKHGIPTGGSSGALKTDSIFTRPFYNKQWHTVYRPAGLTKAEIVASTMEKLCKNNNIEYGTENTMSFYNEARANKWDVSKITTKCTTNTPMAMMIIIRAMGEVLGNADGITFDALESIFKRAGLQRLPFDSKDSLKRGDILVSDTHAAVVLSDGDDVDRRTPAQIVLDVKAANQAHVGKEIGLATTRTSMSVYSGPGIHFIEYKVIPRLSEVAILEVLPEGWFKIVYPYVQAGYGYVQDLSGTALLLEDKSILPQEEKTEELGTEVNYDVYLRGVSSVVNVRKGPGREYAVVGNIHNRQKHTIIREYEGWGYLSTEAGWVNLAKVIKLM